MWQLDKPTMDAFDDLMCSMYQPLDNWLGNMINHADQSPPWLILFTYGKFVMEYNNQRENGHEPQVAYNMALAFVLSDPQIQALMARFTQQAIDKGLGGGF